MNKWKHKGGALITQVCAAGEHYSWSFFISKSHAQERVVVSEVRLRKGHSVMSTGFRDVANQTGWQCSLLFCSAQKLCSCSISCLISKGYK